VRRIQTVNAQVEARSEHVNSIGDFNIKAHNASDRVAAGASARANFSADASRPNNTRRVESADAAKAGRNASGRLFVWNPPISSCGRSFYEHAHFVY
jgi:hypothetical protein